MAFATAFKMPQEPRPLPSLDDDDESFVVLCSNARDSQASDSFSADVPDASVISEAKQLIKQELEALDMESMRCGVNATNQSNEIEETIKKMPPTNKAPESMKAMFSITSLTSDMSSDEIERKLSQLVEENVHLKDTILQNNMALKSQYDKILFWYEDVQKVHRTLKDKLIEAKRVIDALKSDKDSLKRELTEMKRIKDDMTKDVARSRTEGKDPKRNEDDMKNLQLEVANAKIRELEETLEKLEIGGRKSEDNLTSEIEKLRAENEKSLKEIREIRENSTKLTEELRLSKENESKLEQQVIAKTRKEEQLTGQLARAEEKAEHVEVLRAQLAYIQTKLTESECERAQAQAEAVDRSRKEPIDDETCALKVQLDVYKADFDEERRAREAIKAEKDRLEEDLLNLQRRNQQLQEEIEILRNHGDFEPVGASREARPPSNEGTMRCPKCAIKFTDVPQLERHVYRCIELDDHLP
ncbi:unnamed protein product [Phyllotreta striolata]|uniref:Optineurin n=1 Tax=Phyllotreta striolata TaxID=444603 RepID=A0A9N9TJL8_PHYSR|nr:unnamed protein product [Phyllotreta striolata]